MGRPKLIAAIALAGAVVGSCSSDATYSSTTTNTTAGTTVSTPAPAATTSTAAPATTGAAPASSGAPTTSAAPTTSPPTSTVATSGPATTAAPAPSTSTSGGTKTVIKAAGFLVPQGDYSFEDAPDDTVQNFQTLLDASTTVGPLSGTLGGVDVYDAAGTNTGRAFLFVPDSGLPANTVEELATVVAGGVATSPATVGGVPGRSWTSGNSSFFLGEQNGTIAWVIASAANVEPTLSHLLESLGG